MSLNYKVFDLETTVRNREGCTEQVVGEFYANPHCRDNFIVIGGYKERHDTDVTVFDKDTGIAPPSLDTWVVGHNVHFDLLYCMKRQSPELNEAWRVWFEEGGKLFDTMHAEYLITGQLSTMVSLDEVSLKYGGTLKDEFIKEHWKSGGHTEEIPFDRLKPYLEHDVLNTEKVFVAQCEAITKLEMWPLVRSQMEAMVATLEMQFNGMRLDKDVLIEQLPEMEQRRDKMYNELVETMKPAFPEDFPVNPGSSSHVGAFLFGGYAGKYKVRDYVLDENGNKIITKTGKNAGNYKTKLFEHEVYCRGIPIRWLRW